ncbi:hypothetical protein GCM10022381_03900 [Leifsonia kafniensis]|uniref:Integral membrane bound transporter domain-containing protein n=2 Tax=Leifsonia kafniensis TaxID=475957 RepID=A0ABP7K3I6_9MICO
MVTVVAWLCGVILGFGLIYFGLMPGDGFQYSGAHQNLFGALLFSAAQLSTVGTSALSANTDVLRFLSITETLTGVALISLILTFLLGVYDVISNLSALSAKFFSASRGAGDPVKSLAPFFVNGEPNGIDSHLQAISDSFGSYTDGLRLHHAAYYFQSGRDDFSLPYSVRMLGGTIGALRWGLPTGHPASAIPVLIPLTFQFDRFGDYLHPRLRWRSSDVPETVAREDFVRQLAGSASEEHSDRWVARFRTLNREMADLAGTTPLHDLDDAYARYVQWLPFAYRSQQITTAVSRDLDYQPIIIAGEEPPIGPTFSATTGIPVVDAGERQSDRSVSSPSSSKLRSFWERRVILVDPGYARLIAAARALIAAAGASVTLYLLFTAAGADAFPSAFFGGMMAMFTASATGKTRTQKHRFAGLLAIIPVVGAVGLSAAIPHDSYWTTIALVIVAFIGIGIGRFGPAWAGLGQLAFVSYYFTLLLRLSPQEAGLYAAAAIVGVVWSFVLPFIVSPGKASRTLGGGVHAFRQRLIRALDPLIDTVSWARWDPDLRKRVRVDMLQVHRSAAFLAGQLTGTDPDVDLNAMQAAALRLRVFDVELAAINLTTAAREVTGAGIPIALRAQLAGELQVLQDHLRGYPALPAWATGAPSSRAIDAEELPPNSVDLRSREDWPESARRLHVAIVELRRVADALHSAQAVDLNLADPTRSLSADEATNTDDVTVDPTVDDVLTLTDPSGGIPSASTDRFTPTGRRAVQAALSTGLALTVGSLVSTTHQYWAAMPAYQVVGSTDGETFVKGAQRIVGTIVGAAIGFGVAISTEANPAVVLPLLAVCVFASAYYRAVSSPVTTFWQTMLFALLYEFLGKLSTETVELRILETIIGAAIALLVARLVLPLRTRKKLNREITELLRIVDQMTASCLTQLGRGIVESRESRIDRLLALNRQMDLINATAVPLRRASGAMDLGGIEGQLTAIWALVYYTRHLVMATERTPLGASGISADEWARIHGVTRDNLTSLAAVLNGDLPGDVAESIDPPEESDAGQPLTGSVAAALRQLERLNQAALILMEDVTPDAVRPRQVKIASFLE